MNKQHLYFKNTFNNEVFKDTVFNNSFGVLKFVDNVKSHSLNPTETMVVNTYHNMHEIIKSGKFMILTDDSFTEKELHLLLGVLHYNSRCTDDYELVGKLINKLTDMLYRRAYLPNDKNTIIDK